MVYIVLWQTLLPTSINVGIHSRPVRATRDFCGGPPGRRNDGGCWPDALCVTEWVQLGQIVVLQNTLSVEPVGGGGGRGGGIDSLSDASDCGTYCPQV